MSLSPTLIHSHQHRSPVLTLRATCSTVYLQHTVHRVFLLAQHILKFKVLDSLHSLGIVIVNLLLGDHLVLIEVESELELIGKSLHLGVAIEPLLYGLHLLHLLLGTFGVVPEVGRLSTQVFLLKFYLFLVYLKVSVKRLGALHDIL